MRKDFIISPVYLAGVLDLATPDEVSEGLIWHEREQGWVEATAHVYETTPVKVATITSLLSSNAPWDDTTNVARVHRNGHTNKGTVITLLDLLCDHPERLYSTPLFATHQVRAQCEQVYHDPDFTLTPALGPKKYPFACNLLGDLEQFTLDQIGWSAVIGWLASLNTLPAITPKRRQAAELAYRWVAEQLKVSIAQAQAVIWVAWRRIRRELAR